MHKILIAEDDQFLSNAYKVKFAHVGFDLQVASDGQEAVKFAQNFHPDLILLDLIMPKTDGFSALEQLRKIDEFKTTPIIVASNLSQQADLDRAQSLGATDFIIKSDMSLDDIINKINSHLSG